MSAELTKLNTGGYNSGLNELMDNKVDVYLKAKLTKRLTYGEYVGEPNNGFKLLIGDEQKIMNLDNVEVFTCKDKPSLTDDQQVVLEWLKREHFDSYIKSVLSNLYFYVNMTAIGDLENKEIQEMVNAYEKLSQEDFAQVLKVFSQWALEQEAAKDD